MCYMHMLEHGLECGYRVFTKEYLSIYNTCICDKNMRTAAGRTRVCTRVLLGALCVHSLATGTHRGRRCWRTHTLLALRSEARTVFRSLATHIRAFAWRSGAFGEPNGRSTPARMPRALCLAPINTHNTRHKHARTLHAHTPRKMRTRTTTLPSSPTTTTPPVMY